MKTLKAFAMCAIMAVVALAFSACNSNIPSSNPFAGEWTSLDEKTTYTFEKDYTYTKDEVQPDNTNKTTKGEYFYSNSVLTLNEKTDNGYSSISFSYTINKDRMILQEGGAAQTALGEATGGKIYIKL